MFDIETSVGAWAFAVVVIFKVFEVFVRCIYCEVTIINFRAQKGNLGYYEKHMFCMRCMCFMLLCL